MREHINRLDALCAVAVLCEISQIASQCLGVAGNVYDLFGGEGHHHVLTTAGHAAGEVEVVGAVGQGDANALGVGDVAVGLAVDVGAVAYRDTDGRAHAVDLDEAALIALHGLTALGADGIGGREIRYGGAVFALETKQHDEFPPDYSVL